MKAAEVSVDIRCGQGVITAWLGNGHSRGVCARGGGTMRVPTNKLWQSHVEGRAEGVR